MRTEEELQEGFKLGDFEIMPNEGTIRHASDVIRPEPQTLRVLLALAKRDGKLVKKQDLIDEVWGGRPTTDEPITRAIREVRKCFGDSASDPTYVETLHRRGYRLLKPVVLGSESRLPWRLVSAVVAIGFAAIVWFMAESQQQTEQIESHVPARSIAVLPFENLSGKESNAYIVSGLKVALVHAIAAMEDRVVKNGGVDYEKEPDEIAKLLGVESVLTGSMQQDGERLLVSYEISREGRVSFSETLEGNSADLFELHEKLSRAVRADLGDDMTPTLIKGHRPESDAFDNYMRGMYALEYRGAQGNLEAAIELFEAAIAVDPNYGPSYLGLATAYVLIPDYRRLAPTQSQSDWNTRALETIDEGVARDPSIEDAAGSIYGFLLHKEKRWEESEERHIRAVSSDIVDSNAFNWYSRMLSSVGRMDDSLEMALRAVDIDPSSAVINSRAAISYTWLQDKEKAYEYFQRANDLGASSPNHLLAFAFLLSRDDKFEQARNVTKVGMEMSGADTNWIVPVFAAFEDSSRNPDALAVLDKASSEGTVAPQVELIARTLLDDVDGAMAIAKMLERPGEYFEMDLLFVPELIELRQHPEFMPLLDRLNVTSYWKRKGCVWSNDKLSCPES